LKKIKAKQYFVLLLIFIATGIGYWIILRFPIQSSFDDFPVEDCEEREIITIHIPQRPYENDLTFDIIGEDKDTFFLGFGELYSTDTMSIFCFRGDSKRNRPSRGRISFRPQSIALAWSFTTGYDNTKTEYGQWGGGSGWTGQPMAILWNRQEKVKLGIRDSSFLNDDQAIEIIVGSLCGKIYFIDSKTGNSTRPYLSIGNPIKGSVSVDPRKNGLLYVGQGIQHGSRFGAYVFNMFSGEEVFFLNGKDRASSRMWGAFDSNPLVDRESGSVFWPAENGLVYSFSINSDNELRFLRKLKYHHSTLFRAGIESSMAIIENYGFFADNSGTVMCIDLRTFVPVWNVSNGDDSDASIVIDKEDNGHYYLYTGNEVDRFGPVNTAYFRKLDAFTGEEIWKIGRRCRGDLFMGKTNSGGLLSSPLVGKHSLSSFVYCIFSRVDHLNHGEFIAINKYTGEEVFSILLDHYSWASPVDIYDREGNGYLFFTDVSGTVYLIEGHSGEMIEKKKTGYTFESSPIVMNDRIFVGARGNSILSFKLSDK
jgi:outer membrane protein assembly factor BamB